ncbi:MAG: hypothetical protein SPK76_08075 [Bacteroidales bacterium]|nr:hypothetical protein [Bacteroidales bacterium]MDY6444963.1 hypothetical protein [Bacteroidales bacterium]
METRRIPESEFAENFARILTSMARAVAFSGLTISEIAAAARVNWKTVYAVSQGVPVRMDSAARILYFLEDHQKQIEKSGCKSVKL